MKLTTIRRFSPPFSFWLFPPPPPAPPAIPSRMGKRGPRRGRRVSRAGDGRAGDRRLYAEAGPGNRHQRTTGARRDRQPGMRSYWHCHAGGQIVMLFEGTGRVQKRGERIRTLHKGDTEYAGPGVEHWHGAAQTHRRTSSRPRSARARHSGWKKWEGRLPRQRHRGHVEERIPAYRRQEEVGAVTINWW